MCVYVCVRGRERGEDGEGKRENVVVNVSLTIMCVLLVCETDRTPTSHSLALDGPGTGKGSKKCGLEAVTQGEQC